MMGEDRYPLSVTKAYNMLQNWKDELGASRLAVQHDEGGHMYFLQDGGGDGGDNDGERKGDGKDRTELQCYRCGQFKEHYENEYPHTEEEAERLKKAGRGSQKKGAMTSMHLGGDESDGEDDGENDGDDSEVMNMPARPTTPTTTMIKMEGAIRIAFRST